MTTRTTRPSGVMYALRRAAAAVAAASLACTPIALTSTVAPPAASAAPATDTPGTTAPGTAPTGTAPPGTADPTTDPSVPTASPSGQSSTTVPPVATRSGSPTATGGAPGDSSATGASASGDRSSPEFLSLTIDSVTPSVVRAESGGGADGTGDGTAGTQPDGPTVTVRGSVRNVGDRTVSDVDVRLQRAPRVSEDEELRSVLSLDQSSYGTVGLFHTVADSIDEGETVPFTLSLPVNDPSTRSLAIREPGVYPLLVNVNGTPDYGGRARLDDARFLLPVMTLPAGVGNAPETHGPVAPSPVPVTMMYPITAAPELAAGQPGLPKESDEPTRLVSDSLAKSLAAGGRLDGLLAAAEQALSPQQDPHGALAAGLCVAIDPDLLVTVDAMTRGYTVSEDPADPDSDTTGSEDERSAGQAAATEWLRRLRALTAHTCTVSLPYAQADLDAVRTLASPQVTAAALNDPADIVDSVLGVKSLRGLVWPSAGQIAPDTLGTLEQAFAPAPSADGTGGTPGAPPPGDGAADPPPAPMTLLSDNSVDIDSDSDSEAAGSTDTGAVTHGTGGSSGRNAASPSPTGAVHIADAPPATEGGGPPGPPDAPPGGASPALLFDMPTAAALAAAGAAPTTPPFVPESLRFDLAHDSRTARLQDAMGAIAWSLLEARRAAGAEGDTPGGTGASGSARASGPDAGGSAATGRNSVPAPLLIAPPQDWSVGEDEAAHLLSLLQSAYQNGLASPRPLTAAVSAARGAQVPAATLHDPRPGDGIADFAVAGEDGSGRSGGGAGNGSGRGNASGNGAGSGGAGSGGAGSGGAGSGSAGSDDGDSDLDLAWNEDGRVSRSLIDRLSNDLGRLSTLGGMLAGPGPDGDTPEHYITPLYRDVLRAVSTAGRGGDGAAGARTAAGARAAALSSSLSDQFDAVTVVAPGSVYTLASSQSPVLVVAKNDLAVPVSVSLKIQAPRGVQIGQASDYVIPARGSRQIQVPAQIEYSRQIDLRVQLLSPDGKTVGEQIHISLHSNAYGMVIPVLTGVSGALLLFLAGRRGWHRLRGQHDPADDRASERGPVLEQYRRFDAPPGPEDEG